MKQLSANPHRLIAGDGTASERENKVPNPKHNQIWFLKNAQGAVEDIQRYDVTTEEWESELRLVVRSVSGMLPDEDGAIPQVREVGTPPSVSGQENQIGINFSTRKIYWYKDGAWRFVGAVDTKVGASITHSLDPTEDQVSDPTTTPTVSDDDTGGSLDSQAYKWKITFLTEWGETAGSPATSEITPIYGSVLLSDIPTGPQTEESEADLVTGRAIYRTQGNGDTFYHVHTIQDNTTTSWLDDNGDGTLDMDREVPTTNSTEAHNGSLPEQSVSFDASGGHTHNGTDSAVAVVAEHDVDPSATSSPHTGNLPWGQLENVPSTFTPAQHDVDPAVGYHTGEFPWGKLKNVPALADNPHGNAQHDPTFAPDNHDNANHSENYITGATIKRQFPAGQIGDISQQTNLIYPLELDVDCTIEKIVVRARTAPASNVSATVYVPDDSFQEVVTLPAGDNRAKSTLNQGTSLTAGSLLRFSLDDSDNTGQDFSITLMVKYEV